LSASPVSERTFDIAPDGRILGLVDPAAAGTVDAATNTSAQLHVVLNWFEELKRREPIR
jgi:hypothetical protein